MSILVLVSLGLGMVLQPAAEAPRYELKAPWQAADFTGDEELEKILFDFVNTERTKRGAKPLVLVESLRTAARQHSAEMLDLGYFSHESPMEQWKTHSQRAYRAGYLEPSIGENIVHYVANYELDRERVAYELMYGKYGWMNSPGHLANLLSPDWTETGMGVTFAGTRAYATQMFGNRYWDVEDAWLEDHGLTWRLTATAKLLREVTGVSPALDLDLQRPLHPEVGQTIDLSVTIPVDRRRHTVGLHPANGPDRFLLIYLYYLDTTKPAEKGWIGPFDPRAEPQR